MKEFCEIKSGNIKERQTTYFIFENPEEGSYKVAFSGKKEFSIEDSTFDDMFISESHPMLEQYEFTNTQIYIGSKVSDAELLEKQLENAVSRQFEGYREPSEYLNYDYGIRKILLSGSGLIYDGPPSGASAVKKTLDNNQVSYTVPRSSTKREHGLKVLIFGGNYVIAEKFDITKVST